MANKSWCKTISQAYEEFAKVATGKEKDEKYTPEKAKQEMRKLEANWNKSNNCTRFGSIGSPDFSKSKE